MKWLAFPFVFECAYRSIFPALYVERQTFWDSPFDSILINRSFAAIGEVCWMLQVAMALSVTNSTSKLNSIAVEVAAVSIVALSILGEINSFISTATKSQLFAVFEACCWCSIYMIGAVTGTYLFCYLKKKRETNAKSAKTFAIILSISGAILTPFMLISNIPTLLYRWKEDELHHKKYLGFFEGLYDALVTRNPTQNWAKWKGDCLWMSVYFSVAVWSSILLMYSPQVHACEERQSILMTQQLRTNLNFNRENTKTTNFENDVKTTQIL